MIVRPPRTSIVGGVRSAGWVCAAFICQPTCPPNCIVCSPPVPGWPADGLTLPAEEGTLSPQLMCCEQ